MYEDINAYNTIIEDSLHVINIIDKELYDNNLISLNNLILNIVSLLNKDINVLSDEIELQLMEEINIVLIEKSYTYKEIFKNNNYYNACLFFNYYIKKMINYYNRLMLSNQDKFDRYIEIENKMPKNREIKSEGLLMNAQDIQNTMGLLNEAVRKYYEVYNNKTLITTFSDSKIIQFKIKESELAHLLGVNLKKIVNNSKYVDLFKISQLEIDSINNKIFDPLGNAAISILHKITDIQNGNLLTYEEDRIRKLNNYTYKYVGYDLISEELRTYSKINIKSKAFIDFRPLEELSLALNFPKGYEIIEIRKKKVEKGEQIPAQHSLLITKNSLSREYKYTTLIANYDYISNRRYFMSLFLKKISEYNEYAKVATPAVSMSVALADDDGTNAVGVEFTPQQIRSFIEEIITDFKHIDLEELLDYFSNLENNNSIKK